MDITLLHDLKRIAETARALMVACDMLYTDLEKKAGGNIPPENNGRVSILDICKGGDYVGPEDRL